MHTVTDYAPIVAQYVRSNGEAYWDDIYHLISNTVDFDAEDVELLDSDGHERWTRIVMNLKSNRVLSRDYPDIINIAGGFATRIYADLHNIPESTSEDSVPVNHRQRRPRRLKAITGHGSKILRQAFKHHFAALKELYPKKELLADINSFTMTTDEFSIKYNVEPLKI